MQIRRLAWIVVLVGLITMVASAADVAGKWKMEFTAPDGQTRTSTLALKVDGEKLTGTLSSARGDAEISEGKVTGDAVSFVVVRNFGGNEVKITYRGKVAGDEIRFVVEFGAPDRVMEQVAKRVKE